jgi:hypothetical protein
MNKIVLFSVFLLSVKLVSAQEKSGSFSSASGSSITLISVPDYHLQLDEGEEIPPVFDVKAVTTCKKQGGKGISANGGTVFKVSDESSFLQALKTVADGDEIELTANITIKPGPSYPNTLGVWHPLVIGKSITINGGGNHHQLMTERGLPWGIGANVIFKNLNLNMIPESGQRAVIYVSDCSVEFDNVTTKGENNVSSDPDPRPTLVAGTWKDQPSAGDGARILIKNGSYETIFADIFSGNHTTAKSTPTVINIQSDEVRVKGGIFACGLTGDNIMNGVTTIVSSSRRISRYEGNIGGGDTFLEFNGADVIPNVQVANIKHVLLSDESKVMLNGNSNNISGLTVGSGSTLSLSENAQNKYNFDLVEGQGNLYITQNIHLEIGMVEKQPIISIRGWMLKPELILDLVNCPKEQPADILYFVNEELYIRKNGLLIKYDGVTPPDAELYDAYVEYQGQTREDYDEYYVLERTWRAYDECGGEEFFTQKIEVFFQIPTKVEEIGKAQLLLTPNPVVDRFKIDGLGVAAKVCVYNLLGMQVKTMDVAPYYDISNLPDGVYLVVAESEGTVARFKVTKRK